ncbi:MAG: DUF4124 domain-containing protein [Xanthomonadales bacterium]|nr:DUF4124 domain-containing protein [Xanthomonadales bacterium]
MKATRHWIIFMLMLALAGAATQASAQVYRWVDKDGVVHYGDRAPDGVEATLVTVNPNTVPVPAPPEPAQASAETVPQSEEAEEEPLSYAEQRRRERAERRSEFREAEQERQATCTAARNRVAYLEPTPRVLVEDEDGSTRRLDDEERLRLLEEAKAYLAENCGQD